MNENPVNYKDNLRFIMKLCGTAHLLVDYHFIPRYY